jgi:glycosyltransferase involved in cell wall biosynthesis
LKVDVCTWTRNGARSLPTILERVDRVVPFGRKIAVDDSSSDDTVRILEDFNYEVYRNERGFLCGGTSEALKHVGTEYFVSVEQDVLLGFDWWNSVSRFLKDKYVAVAQGVEYSTCRAEHGIEKTVLKHIQNMPPHLKSRLWKSIGNNVYRTSAVRQVGFVSDSVMMQSFYNRIINAGYKWVTDDTTVSTHLHGGLLGAVKHTRQFYGLTNEKTFLDRLTTLRFLAGFALSPFTGLKLAINSREPTVPFLHIGRKFALWPVFLRRRNK